MILKMKVAPILSSDAWANNRFAFALRVYSHWFRDGTETGVADKMSQVILIILGHPGNPKKVATLSALTGPSCSGSVAVLRK
jgi:hypothetical protein